MRPTDDHHRRRYIHTLIAVASLLATLQCQSAEGFVTKHSCSFAGISIRKRTIGIGKPQRRSRLLRVSNKADDPLGVRGRKRLGVSLGKPAIAASVSSDLSTSSDDIDEPETLQDAQFGKSFADKIMEMTQQSQLPSLGKEGLSKFHQSLLSHSTKRQRFVTGKYPLRITVEENPTRKWLGLGRDRDVATAQLLVNGTTADRSLASYDRFQWIDEDEREELFDRYSLVSLELIAEINVKKPGYVNVLPTNGAGSSAAVQRVATSTGSWNKWKRNSVLYEQVEQTKWEGPYRDRLWVTGFSIASQRGYLHSIDADTGHIESVNSRTGKSILWPNESNSVPLPRYKDRGAGNALGYNPMDDLDDALLISDGFLVPGKDRGGLYVVRNPGDEDTEWTVCITGGPDAPNDAWFYHRSVWVDLTGDGRKSILTARAKPPSMLNTGSRSVGSDARNKPKKSQLVWLEMPQPNSIDSATGTPLEDDGTVFDPFSARHLPWKVRVLDEGPDVMFTVADLDSTDDTIEVIASQFFDRKVTLHSIRRGLSPIVTFRRTIDDKCGAAFGAILADLDCCRNSPGTNDHQRLVVDSGSTVQTRKPGDSFSHVLVTSHECSFDDSEPTAMSKYIHGELEGKPEDHGFNADECTIDGGSLFAYRVPTGKDAWKSEPWDRTTVASGFRVKGKLGNMINPGAPGFVYTFHAKKDDAISGKRPLIAIAGDCAESAYVYRPTDEIGDNKGLNGDPSARYKLMCELQCGATVGSIGIGYDDFYTAEQQRDYAKLYIPCYEIDKIYVFAMGDGDDDYYGLDGDSGW